jgi:hypothetical protein
MSNFAYNNLSFPSTTKQTMHLTCHTIESSPKTNYAQRNLTTQVMNLVIRSLKFLDWNIVCIKTRRFRCNWQFKERRCWQACNIITLTLKKKQLNWNFERSFKGTIMTSKQECEWIKENKTIKWSKKIKLEKRNVKNMHLWWNLHDATFIASKVMFVTWVPHLQTSKLSIPKGDYKVGWPTFWS